MMDITIKEITTQRTAFELYSAFEGEDIIFLDSAKDPDRLGRYSIIGLSPFKKVTCDKGIVREDGRIREGTPFKVLNELLRRYKVKNDTGLPFIGGALGYFGYDQVRTMEDLPTLNQEEAFNLPMAYFVFYDNGLIIDHHKGRVYITELRRNKAQKSRLSAIEARIEASKAQKVGPLKEMDGTCHSSFDRGSYMATVEAMRQYIRMGDIYIANMTHRFLGTTDREALDIYKVLRHINPAPFGAYMPLEGFQVLSSSPERFLKIRHGKVETRPIKGTVPRGRDGAEDMANIRRLEESEKDKAELLMVVDLERNDLSRVCRPYTVKVTELFAIESYATVHHLVSTIEGRLKEGKSAVDCMEACFPGGSITGTPKIRAMEIIETLERSRRGLYTGCIGYFGYDGGADFNIVIRTIIKKGRQVSIGVGGGITWGSDPAAEYEETLDKGAALFRALRTVEVTDATVDGR